MSNEQVRQTNHHSNTHRATNTLTEHYSLPEVWSAVGPLFQYPHKHTDRTLHTARGVVSSGSIIPIPTQIQTEHYTLPEVWSAVGTLFQYPYKHTDRTLLTARGVVSSGSSARGGGWPFSPQPIKGVGPILSPCAVVTVEVASNTSLSCAEIKAMF